MKLKLSTLKLVAKLHVFMYKYLIFYVHNMKQMSLRLDCVHLKIFVHGYHHRDVMELFFLAVKLLSISNVVTFKKTIITISRVTKHI